MRSKGLLIIALIVAAVLALTNPNEDKFRAHIQEQQGIMGSVGLGLADLLSSGSSKSGIHRDNYLLFSKFYLGGDGILPRQDLAWGVAGTFFDIAEKK